MMHCVMIRDRSMTGGNQSNTTTIARRPSPPFNRNPIDPTHPAFPISISTRIGGTVQRRPRRGAWRAPWREMPKKGVCRHQQASRRPTFGPGVVTKATAAIFKHPTPSSIPIQSIPTDTGLFPLPVVRPAKRPAKAVLDLGDWATTKRLHSNPTSPPSRPSKSDTPDAPQRRVPKRQKSCSPARSWGVDISEPRRRGEAGRSIASVVVIGHALDERASE